MAWTATFVANFEQFDTALRSIEPKLGAFDQNVKAVGRSLQKMTSEFDGTKVTQQAATMATAIEKAGGAAKLTESELRRANTTLQEAIEKYKKLEQAAPSSLTSMAEAVKKQLGPLDDATKKTGLWGSALGSVKTVAAGFVAGFTLDRVLTGIGSAVTSTINWAGSISDLSAKVGVSTTALQRWEFAANRSGNSLEQLVGAAQMLGARLAEGDASAVAGIEKLGLSLESLRAMSPEQQFETVASALAKVQNNGERTALAMDALGRQGKEVLPTLTADLRAVGDEAARLGAVVSGDTIEAMDSLGDAWGDLKLIGRGLLSEVLEPMVPTLRNIAQGMKEMSQPGSMGWLERYATATQNPLLLQAAGIWMGDRGMKRSQDMVLPGISTEGWQPSSTTVINSEAWYVAAIEEETRQHQEAARRTKQLMDAQRAYIASLREMGLSAWVSGGTVHSAVRPVTMLPGSVSFGPGFTGGSVSPFGGGAFNLAAGIGAAANPQNPFALSWGGVSPQLTAPTGTQLIPTGYGGLGQMYVSSSLLNYMPPPPPPSFNARQFGIGAVNAAMPWASQLIGGGSQGAQWGGTIGGGIGGALGASFATATGAMGTIAPFLGPALGIAGSLIGKLFGPSQGAIEGKKADAEIGQLQQQLLQTYGSLDEIRRVGGAAGDALAAAWGDKNVRGLAHFKGLLQDFNQHLKDTEQQTLDYNQALADLTTYGTNGWKAMQEAAQKYGIDLDSLGDPFKQGKITDGFNELYRAYRLLVDQGADVGGVLSGMADEASKLYQESERLGTAIPEQWRPLLENLVEAGRLLDANGEKVTDLSNIRWADGDDPLMKGVTDLIARIGELVDVLARGLPEAAEMGARGIETAVSGVRPTIRINYEYDGPDGRPTIDTGDHSYASGTPGIVDFGRGTLAMLHGREIVQTEAQYRASMGAGLSIQPAPVVLDRRVIGEVLFEVLPPALQRFGVVPR